MNSPHCKPSPRGRRADGSPHPVDVYVGHRMHLRRVMLGLSQEDLALQLGITFQQVQKYERGLNRISSSRLYDISNVLKVDVGYFFAGYNDDSTQTDDNLRTDDSDSDYNEETLLLINAFSKIKKASVRRLLYKLALSLSSPNSTPSGSYSSVDSSSCKIGK